MIKLYKKKDKTTEKKGLLKIKINLKIFKGYKIKVIGNNFVGKTTLIN